MLICHNSASQKMQQQGLMSECLLLYNKEQRISLITKEITYPLVNNF